MSIRQYYYTSYVDKRTGRSGFQIKAMSPGLSSELQTVLVRLIAYRIPPTLESQDPATHPVALRYYRAQSGEYILLVSQSSGSDEYGRPGNFFAHALILEQNNFSHIPPICFWKSSFWCSKDLEERAHVPSLPVLTALNEKPSLVMEDVWSFLAQGNQRALLYSLLCAVVHSSKMQCRIVIIDTSEHVALWIAAVSYLLPLDYRPLLTFATYHHNPYQAHYLITGTTRDSSFYASAKDALSFFILDAETNSASPVEASPYGELVVEALQQAHRTSCEAALLSVFNDYARRFPRPVVIDEQLDHLALYTKIQRGQYSCPLTEEEIDVIHNALSSFESLHVCTQKEKNELEQIEHALRRTMKSSLASAVQKEYARVLALLTAYQISTTSILFDELVCLVELLIAQNQSKDSFLDIQMLCQLYGEEQIRIVINSPDYLQWLTEYTEMLSSKQRTMIWQQVGEYIQLEVQMPLFIKERLLSLAFSSLSLTHFSQAESVLCRTYQNHPSLPADIRVIMDSIVALMSGQMTVIQAQHLRNAVARLPVEEYKVVMKRYIPTFFSHNISHESHLHLIQTLFGRSLDLMIPDDFWQIYLDTLIAMLRHSTSVIHAVEMIDFWFSVSPYSFAQGYPVQQFFLLLPSSIRTQPLSQKNLLAFDGLAAHRSWYASVRAFLAPQQGILQRLGQQVLTYIKERNEDKEVTFKRTANHQIIRAFKAEMGKLFEEGEIVEGHEQCMKWYTMVTPPQFWSCYWKNLIQLLTSGNADRILALLLFWFDLSYDALGVSHYMPQEFFVGLHRLFESAATLPGFHETAYAVNEKASDSGTYHWYSLVAHYFGGEK